MFKNLSFIIILAVQLSFGQSKITGVVTNNSNEKIPFATVLLEEVKSGVAADMNGVFIFDNIKEGSYTVKVSSVGYRPVKQIVKIGSNETKYLSFKLQYNGDLDEVEVFGSRFTHPDKIEALTRLPLESYDQIQSISIISEKVIEQQGNLTIADAVKNVPGVYTFATYGNKRESMSSRGFRGIPVLKNGVRVHSDFRGQGILTDMQGVDNIQVLKGAASVTQGVATDLGSPGGIINIVTKTPKYEFGGNVAVRGGSFGQARTTFDIYGPITTSKTTAFRLNGALERADSYRDGVTSDRFYINPSFQWKADDKTTITFEMDYFEDSRTPDLGTVNLGDNDQNLIYDLPYDQFLGFEDDKSLTTNTTYAVRFDRELTDKLSLKGAYYKSTLDLDDKGASLGRVVSDVDGNAIFNQKSRGYSVSTRADDNSVIQFDVVGDEVKTGALSHTFQVGFDYRTSNYNTTSQIVSVIDTIDVFISNTSKLPTDISLSTQSALAGESKAFGFVAQDVITFNKYLKGFFGLRYSKTRTITAIQTTESDAFNPLGGIIISPVKNINVFASYTNSSYPRTGTRLDVNGNELGNERYDQFETGIKTNWLNNRLRFNLTYFKINNKDINLPVYNVNWEETGYYAKGGNDERKGIEIELSGRILDNLEVITGYSYIDAQFKEHTSYVYGSAPLNTPKHTFNIYANYSFTQQLQGLSVGGGVYYTGARPINDWSSGAITHQGIVPNQKPFNVEAYTQVNTQVAYNLDNHWNFRVLVNNIFDSIGYNAYRTSYINQTDPRNFAGVLTYKF